MREKLDWLIYGPNYFDDKLSHAKLMGRMLAVSKIRRRLVSAEELLRSLEGELSAAGCNEVLRKVFRRVCKTLASADDAIYYFVLYLTGCLSPGFIKESLAVGAYAQSLVAGHLAGRYEEVPDAPLALLDGIPWLPWDLRPALITEAVFVPEKKPQVDYIGEPLTVSGQVAPGFLKILRSQANRLLGKISADIKNIDDDTVLLKIYEFDGRAMLAGVAGMFRGIGSDLFQQSQKEFYLQPHAEVRDGRIYWQLNETRSFLSPVVEQANLLNHQISDFLPCKHRGVRKILIEACEKQISVFHVAFDRIAKRDQPMQIVLRTLMEAAEDLALVLTICTDLIEKDCPEVELASLLSDCQRMTTRMASPALLLILRDVRSYITSSLCAYLSHNLLQREREQYDYSEEFCGPLDDLRTQSEFTTMARACRVFREISAGVGGSEDLDELYKDAIEKMNFEEELQKVLDNAGTLSLSEMLRGMLRPLSSSVLLHSLVEDYKGALKLISAVFLPISTQKLLPTSAITAKRLLSMGIPKRQVMSLQFEEKEDRSVVYEAPSPLSMIILEKHAVRFTYIREQFLLLCKANDALHQINSRVDKFPLGEARIAFFRRATMLKVVGALHNHVVSMACNVWAKLQADLAEVTSLNDVINAHRRFMRRLLHRTLLETKSRASIRIIKNVSDYCTLFAAAFGTGDARSCESHFNEFRDQLRVLCERMATETDNTHARVLLVQLDMWEYVKMVGNRSALQDSLLTERSLNDSPRHFY